MKKVLVVLLVAALVLSACGGAPYLDTSDGGKKAAEMFLKAEPKENVSPQETVAVQDVTVQPASDENSMTPTGYASGEIQIPMLFFDGHLWLLSGWSDRDPNALRSVQSLSDTYTLVGQIREENAKKVPETEMAAAHIEVGEDVYLSAKDDTRGEHLYVRIGEWYFPMRPFQPEDAVWIAELN